jgi:transposase
MDEALVLQMILNLPDVIVTRVEIGEKCIEVYISSAYSESLCPLCMHKVSQINQIYERLIRDLPISGKEVYLHLEERQFVCKGCNRYFSEGFSFVNKHSHHTERYGRYLYEQIRISSIQEVIELEDICWKTAQEIFKKESEKVLSGTKGFLEVRRIGIDEFALKKGHKNYATVLIDLDRLCVLEVLPYREQALLMTYFKQKGQVWCEQIEVFCSDMWDGFVGTAKRVFPHAEIVIDRFHFFKHLNQALDNERKALRKTLKGEEKLKHIKWALLKNYQSLNPQEKQSLDLAFKIAPSLQKVHQAKEELRQIFEQDLQKQQAQTLIDQWAIKAFELNNVFLNAFINTLNYWKDYILNYFNTRLTTSIVEGFNNKIKMIKRRGFGFRNFDNFKYRIFAAFQ